MLELAKGTQVIGAFRMASSLSGNLLSYISLATFVVVALEVTAAMLEPGSELAWSGWMNKKCDPVGTQLMRRTFW